MSVRFAAKRFDTLRVGARTWKQPPIRVWHCSRPNAPDAACAHGYCDASGTPCPCCLFSYCDAHLSTHMRSMPFPPDAWKTVFKKICYRTADAATALGKTAPKVLVGKKTHVQLRRFEIDGQVVRNAIPARIQYCITPKSRLIDAACGHEAKSCKSGSTQCPFCLFTYCPHHYERHVRRFAWPGKEWRIIVERYEKRKARVERRETKSIYVDVPGLDLKDVAK